MRGAKKTTSPSQRLVRINHWWLDADGCIHSGRNQTTPVVKAQGRLVTTEGSTRTYHLLEPHPRVVANCPGLDKDAPLADRDAVARAWLVGAGPRAGGTGPAAPSR